jgi:hypothetical protein
MGQWQACQMKVLHGQGASVLPFHHWLPRGLFNLDLL